MVNIKLSVLSVSFIMEGWQEEIMVLSASRVCSPVQVHDWFNLMYRAECVLKVKNIWHLFLCFESFIYEALKYFTKCWVRDSDPTCLLNEYWFNLYSFCVYLYKECIYFQIIDLECFMVFG